MPGAPGANPDLVILAGPNGAGKTTAAPALLRDTLAVSEFVNADVIAQGLSGFDPGARALAAGRLMLERIKSLAAARRSFAFETTLASRSFAPWLGKIAGEGYRVHLVFLWLPSPAMACARVAARVGRGGHAVPEATIRRRYQRGLQNLFDLYIALVTSWQLFDNSHPRGPRSIARGLQGAETLVFDEETWSSIRTYG